MRRSLGDDADEVSGRDRGRFAVCIAALALAWGALAPSEASGPRKIDLRHVSLDLPGYPSAVVDADLDGDGRRDLLVVVVYTNWGEVVDDRIENLVQFVDVVPALFVRREARAYLATESGGYTRVPEPLPLHESVLSVEAGPAGLPAVALTDDGLSVFRVSGTSPPVLSVDPVLSDPPVVAGAETFISNLGMVRDVDGDGKLDVLLPARDGPALYRSTGTGLSTAPVQRLKMPGDRRRSGEAPSRRYPVPRIEDVDGDRIPDLLASSGAEARASIHVLRGAGEGRFLEPREISLGCLGLGRIPKEGKKKKGEERAEETDVRDLAYFGDIDGDGTAEAITNVELDTGKGDMKQAKEPEYRFRFHRVREGSVVAQPYQELAVVGHPFSGEWPDVSNVGFVDLDGDGRKDLVTVTLDFSVLQIVRVLATKRITVGLDFHVWAQGPDGRFEEVKGLDLSEKLRFDLNDLRIGRFAQFGGDFDGDGRSDFVHLGRGKTVTIHRGQPGCRYAREPDLTIQLEEEPQDLALVRVVDLDGDGRDDLAITRPLPVPEPGVSPPARLELYLSGGAR